MPSWTELGSVFNTLRELDVSAIRDEAERSITITCLGESSLHERLSVLLRAQGTQRHGAAGASPLRFKPLASLGDDAELERAELLLLLFDGRRPLPRQESTRLERVAALAVPTVVLIVGSSERTDLGAPRAEFAHAQIVVLSSLEEPTAAATIAAAIFSRLPSEFHLAVARRLPGLRATYAQDLTSTVSFTNASFAAASALPEQIPILSVPFVAADMLVLTKNQALMVYRMALAFGAPPEFKDRIAELTPVIGGGFLWRQLARSLIGLVPVWGVVPKVAIAYAGTYTTGIAAWRWYASSEILSRERLRQLTDEALRVGRQRAQALVEATRTQGKQARRGLARLRLPGRPKPDAPSVQDTDTTPPA